MFSFAVLLLLLLAAAGDVVVVDISEGFPDGMSCLLYYTKKKLNLVKYQ